MISESSPVPNDIAAGYNAAVARTASIRLHLRWFDSVSSTMDLAAKDAQDGAPEGLVIGAEEQTAGRGRRGRSWISPAGAGLYLSFVLRPPYDQAADPRVLALITLAAGVAVRDGIARATGLTPDLKWPNDVVIGRRKLAGVLAEGHDLGTPGQTIILGVGINVRDSSYPPDVASRATSLASELGRVVDRAALLEHLLVALATWYDRLRTGDLDGILRAWRQASPSARGARVVWADGHASGVTAGVDESGALLVATETGTARVVSGELTWL